MELKAENSFTVTKDLFFEGMRRLIARDYIPIAKKAVIAVAAVWLLLLAITLHTGGHIVVTLIELAAALLACFWLLVMIPKKRIKRAWKAQEDSGAGMTRTTKYYEDRMEIEKGTGDTLIINYENVADIIESENLLILINEKGVGVMNAKSAFTKGDIQTVKDLIKEWSK